MSDLKLELEKKRAKLQAIKAEKERRRRERELKDVRSVQEQKTNVMMFNIVQLFNFYVLQAEEAALRTSHADKDQNKEIDEMLSSLGVAPVSGMVVFTNYSVVLIPLCTYGNAAYFS